jgi:hypothetical protein
MSWLSRFANLFRGAWLDREPEDEQSFHIEARRDELIRGGLAREEAEQAAPLRFGNRLHLREASREARLFPFRPTPALVFSQVHNFRHSVQRFSADQAAQPRACEHDDIVPIRSAYNSAAAADDAGALVETVK